MRAFLLLVAGTLTATAFAQTSFYSVESTSASLVEISSTGSLTTIGTLGFTTNDAELEWHQGTLYLLDSAASNVNLYTVNVNTGAATFITQITDSGSPVRYVEGLASDGNVLRITHWPAGSSSSSSHFSEVNTTTGAMSNTDSGIRDIDALTFDGAQHFGLDVTGTGSYTLYANSGSPKSFVGSFANAAVGNVNSLEYADSTLWGISAQGTLMKISTSNAAASDFTVISSDTRRYQGIAAVPEPTTMSVLAIAALLCRRKKRR